MAELTGAAPVPQYLGAAELFVDAVVHRARTYLKEGS
jgi:hypothetical protein